jgi:hypothetical protein
MIKWKTDTFTNLKDFDYIPFEELVEVYYKKQLNYLLEDGYELKSKETPLEFFTMDKNTIKFNKIAIAKGGNNITLDLGNKEYPLEFYENSGFYFYKTPNKILNLMTSHLHQPDVSIMNKFHEEVDWDGDWKSLMDEYDKKYPQKHITNKKEGEFSWRANFALVWWFSMRDEGIINPLIISPYEVGLFGRGSHRCYMFGKLGYDFPMFLPKIENKMGHRKFYEVNLDTRRWFNNERLRLLYNGQRKTAAWFRNIELEPKVFEDDVR